MARVGLVQGIGALELGIAGEVPRSLPCHLAQLAEQFAEAHHGLGCGEGEAGRIVGGVALCLAPRDHQLVAVHHLDPRAAHQLPQFPAAEGG